MLLLVTVFYCSLQLYLGCSFLFNLLLHNLRSFRHRHSPGHVLVHEAQVLILLAKSCQLIFDDCFDFFFRALLQVLLVFGGLVLVRGWRLGV
jgi:hypothetical protein